MKNCPYCGSDDVEIPTVDNGVGLEQCGPAQCWSCGATQLDLLTCLVKDSNITEEERRLGWIKGPNEKER